MNGTMSQPLPHSVRRAEPSHSSEEMPDKASALRFGTFNSGLGFLRKLPHILTRASQLALDIIALQEIGDPALLSTRLRPYTLVYTAGPSAHQAGVGLLLSEQLGPRIRRHHRASTGRLVGTVLELNRGELTLVVSAYMPSGLDHSASGSSQHALATQLYDELLCWSGKAHRVIVMGDLNETLTPWDRAPRLAAARPAFTPISCMQQEGFTDVYRHVHPSPHAAPGFTHAVPGARPSQSRIDYLWCRGFAPASFQRVGIDNSLHTLSHHRLLWMEMRTEQIHTSIAGLTQAGHAAQHQHLPNLRKATPEQQQLFIQSLDAQLMCERGELQLLISSDDIAAHALDAVASRLTALTHDCTIRTLPLRGGATFLSKHMRQLQQQRRSLSRLLRLSTSLMHTIPAARRREAHLYRSPEWAKQYRNCVAHLRLQWRIDPCTRTADALEWIKEIQQLLNRTRHAMRKEQQRMRGTCSSDLRNNRFHAGTEASFSPAALVHRMLKSDALPSQIHAVVDKHGCLTATADELKDTMASHFASVFALPDDPPTLPAGSPPPPRMLFIKDGIDPRWYDGLMRDVSEQDVLDVLQDATLVSAPGDDEVSTGVWKIALRGSTVLRALVASLFSGCLQSASFPAAWKTSVIVPLVKKPHEELTMSNIRPISLQPCLGKLLTKILARRLGDIFARFPILHPAQRGFVNGGCITKCIDELLDAWDWSRRDSKGKQHELYTVFYDIKQAYDSVQASVLVRAMKRLHMPAAFICLIEDSLTGLTSCVRTAFGLTRLFDVLRSLRQGDPLAPLLFVILMDALHDGLECNPFTHQRHGLQLQLSSLCCIDLASLGYADDTSALADTLANLRIQNEWVHYFMAFNCMQLNPQKCELVGRDAAGAPVTARALAEHGITIAGQAIEPIPHNQPIRYLGVHCCFDGSWRAQHSKSLAAVNTFARAVNKFRVSLQLAAYMFNVFLLPKLELALRYVHGAGTQSFIDKCDRVLVGCIKHACSSPLSLSHSAVALATGVVLPSWIEICSKVSELFLRANSTQCRWGRIGRAITRLQLPSTVDADTPLPRANSGNRLTRAAWLAVTRLGWALHFHRESREGNRHQLLFERQPAGPLPDLTVCSTSQELRCGGHAVKVAQDLWHGWGATAGPVGTVIHVYTDGSADTSSEEAGPQPSSAWAVTVADEWLDSRFGSIPTEERLLKPAHVAGAALFGAAIACTRGVYAAELQAIARALAMFPTSCDLHIHSDSEAALAGIRAFDAQTNERRRLRMQARPLLQLIHHLLHRRDHCGALTLASHVKAHTNNADMNSVGNRLTDYHANMVRAKPEQQSPGCLRELPLGECDHHMLITDGDGRMIIDDVRRSSIRVIKQAALARWAKRASDMIEGQGALAGKGMLALSRAVMTRGPPSLQLTLPHVATNSLEFYWPAVVGAVPATVQRLQCGACRTPLSLSHLTRYLGQQCVAFRVRLGAAIRKLLSDVACSRTWLQSKTHLGLEPLLLALFPFPAGLLSDSAEERRRHLTLLFAGAFTSAQATAAAKAIGFNSNDPQGRELMLQMRLLCLESIGNAYRSWKEAAGIYHFAAA
jgi:exonuclease III/ribonuclease HI